LLKALSVLDTFRERYTNPKVELEARRPPRRSPREELTVEADAAATVMP
jgi:hypothetical protein